MSGPVGTTGRGIERAPGNLPFLARPKALPAPDFRMRRWPRLREAVALAEGLDTRVVLFVDAEGRFLVVTQVDHKLCDVGSDVARFVEAVLRGRRWPAATPPVHA